MSSVFFAGIHRVGKDEVFIATTLRRPEDDAGQRARTSALPAKVQASLSAVKDAHVSFIFFAATRRVGKDEVFNCYECSPTSRRPEDDACRQGHPVCEAGL